MIHSQLISRGIKDKKILNAMEKVKREEFIPNKLKDLAYYDGPLPIGEEQTISQPYIVALMTEELILKKEDKVLEIGAGSGYQAAILAEIVKEVYTIEIKKNLAEKVKKRLKRLGYDNIFVMQGDGSKGWEQHAPYDKIIITAATKQVPDKLIEQLKKGGKMILPLGDPNFFQNLTLITKQDNRLTYEKITEVRFVPLTNT